MYIMITLAMLLAVYLVLRRDGDEVGWWLGLIHGAAALLAVGLLDQAQDTGFALFLVLLAIYGGAMCCAEAVDIARRKTAAR